MSAAPALVHKKLGRKPSAESDVQIPWYTEGQKPSAPTFDPHKGRPGFARWLYNPQAITDLIGKIRPEMIGMLLLIGDRLWGRASVKSGAREFEDPPLDWTDPTPDEELAEPLHMDLREFRDQKIRIWRAGAIEALRWPGGLYRGRHYNRGSWMYTLRHERWAQIAAELALKDDGPKANKRRRVNGTVAIHDYPLVPGVRVPIEPHFIREVCSMTAQVARPRNHVLFLDDSPARTTQEEATMASAGLADSITEGSDPRVILEGNVLDFLRPYFVRKGHAVDAATARKIARAILDVGVPFDLYRDYTAKRFAERPDYDWRPGLVREKLLDDFLEFARQAQALQSDSSREKPTISDLDVESQVRTEIQLLEVDGQRAEAAKRLHRFEMDSPGILGRVAAANGKEIRELLAKYWGSPRTRYETAAARRQRISEEVSAWAREMDRKMERLDPVP